MLNLKNNFKNNKNGDILCPRCHKDIGNKQHLFERWKQLEDLYQKYKIKGYEIDRLKEIIEFIKEICLE